MTSGTCIYVASVSLVAKGLKLLIKLLTKIVINAIIKLFLINQIAKCETLNIPTAPVIHALLLGWVALLSTTSRYMCNYYVVLLCVFSQNCSFTYRRLSSKGFIGAS